MKRLNALLLLLLLFVPSPNFTLVLLFPVCCLCFDWKFVEGSEFCFDSFKNSEVGKFWDSLNSVFAFSVCIWSFWSFSCCSCCSVFSDWSSSFSFCGFIGLVDWGLDENSEKSFKKRLSDAKNSFGLVVFVGFVSLKLIDCFSVT